jgi:hypothetical protein
MEASASTRLSASADVAAFLLLSFLSFAKVAAF